MVRMPWGRQREQEQAQQHGGSLESRICRAGASISKTALEDKGAGVTRRWSKGPAEPWMISLGLSIALSLPEGWASGCLHNLQSKSPSGGSKAWLFCAQEGPSEAAISKDGADGHSAFNWEQRGAQRDEQSCRGKRKVCISILLHRRRWSSARKVLS